jgi:hypothetical protein
MIVYHLYVNYFLLSKKKIFLIYNIFVSYLAVQNSYELVKLNSNDEHPLLYQVPRLKQPVTDGMSCLICVCVYMKYRVFFFVIYTCDVLNRE